MSPIITLLTDFGVESTYPAQMKGVILSRCPEARLVDLTHGVPRHDVRTAAFMLASAAPAFPKGTVHLCVVDPGVGSRRRAMAARIGANTYVAPDNGLLSVVMKGDGEGEPEVEARSIENPEVMRRDVSSTFHGRDIFAPAAAALADGRPFEDLGPRIEHPARIALPEPDQREGEVVGEVQYIDPFGNLVTNIRRSTLDCHGVKMVRVAGALIRRLSAAYSDVTPGMLLAYIGSAGYLEVAVNQASALQRLSAEVGTTVHVELGKAEA